MTSPVYPSWYRVLICGARDYQDMRQIRDVIAGLKAEHGSRLIIIEGEADGADKGSRMIAEDSDIHVARVHALWQTRRRGAGPQRNTAMLALQPHEVIAFHRDITQSKGTKNTVAQARKAGIPVRVIS